MVITNDQELAVTQQRLRQCETAENYALMAIAYLLELDKMNEEIRSYLAGPPTHPTAARL